MFWELFLPLFATMRRILIRIRSRIRDNDYSSLHIHGNKVYLIKNEKKKKRKKHSEDFLHLIVVANLLRISREIGDTSRAMSANKNCEGILSSCITIQNNIAKTEKCFWHISDILSRSVDKRSDRNADRFSLLFNIQDNYAIFYFSM
jgi:hypothetical protein